MKPAAPAHPFARGTSASCTSHWSGQYVGIPYSENDCAELAVRVQREIFGKDVVIPTARSGLRGNSKTMQALLDDYACLTKSPADGDLVILVQSKALWHAGVYCLINNEEWILHALKNAQQTVRTRVRELWIFNMTIEGIYKWK